MDLFGDMLFQCFRADHADRWQVEQLRPALRARLSKLRSGRGRSGALWNADRLINRFRDYPHWLRKRAANFDLFHLVDHSYSQLLLELPAGRSVVTCHDLDTFLCLLEPAKDPRPRWFRSMAQRTLKGFLGATHVLCPSEFTREHLLRHRLFPPEQVTVIPPGADPAFFAPPDQASAGSVAKLLEGCETFLLHVGSTIRRKRVDVLLKVFARVAERFPGLRLVRVGGPWTAEQSQLARDLKIDGQVLAMPRLTKAQLAALYQQAALVLQTSDAEGFGLPVIEALACGCPVLASDIPPLREAGGEAVEYCPVGNVESWAESVRRLLSERSSQPEDWQTRRESARRHAARFTWTENANRTIEIYQRVLRGPNRSVSS